MKTRSTCTDRSRSMISFDRAIKRLLRQKANYGILEGLLSELLRRKIIIKGIGESEGNKTDVGEIYPEYYIISLKGFNDVAKSTLDEWVYYLKNNRIEDHFTAQGLDRAKELLLFDNLTDDEKNDYLRAVDARLVKDGEITTAQFEGEIRGEHKKAVTVAKKMLQKGMPIDEIME